MAAVRQRCQLRSSMVGALARTSRPSSAAPTSFLCRNDQRRTITTKQLDIDKKGRERVLVLGSGWAGYSLSRNLDPAKYQVVVVVSPRSYFVFTPLLASTCVGTLEFRTALEPVRSRRLNAAFFQGWADDIDFDKKTLTVEESVADNFQGLALTGDRHPQSQSERKEEKAVESAKGELFDISYDKLVVAVGCYSQTFNTPGVKENALFLKDVGDARKIRKRILECFETAALPTTSETQRKQLLNFAVVGGGPTGIEFSAELHDLIKDDLSKVYPYSAQAFKITVYDVAPKVLSMFDDKLADYAMNHFKRQGIEIKTSHHVQNLRKGVPSALKDSPEIKDPSTGLTMTVKEEGEIGTGMVVWSTGLMMNPFVERALKQTRKFPSKSVASHASVPEGVDWTIKHDFKTGGLLTDDKLRVKLLAKTGEDEAPETVLKDVFALGDCAVLEGTMYPATAQVANQKAEWLAKRLNKGDIESQAFTWKNMGVMAYVGNWNAIMQGGKRGPDVSGRAAWVIWRGAYLAKSVSWRNRILIPAYW
ncbi:MAG: hypothetical protein M1819_006084 [Sarea resinae]|nr:MAG: hypothetical protein M1819_006084 [Sarea resinae]